MGLRQSDLHLAVKLGGRCRRAMFHLDLTFGYIIIIVLIVAYCRESDLHFQNLYLARERAELPLSKVGLQVTLQAR